MKKTYIWGWPKYKDDLELKTTWFGRLYIARVYTTLVVLVRLQWTPCPPLLAAFLGHFHPENILKRNSNHMKPISVKGRQTPPPQERGFLVCYILFWGHLNFQWCRQNEEEIGIKHEETLKHKDDLKIEDAFKNEDDHKNKDNCKAERNSKMKASSKMRTTLKMKMTSKWMMTSILKTSSKLKTCSEKMKATSKMKTTLRTRIASKIKLLKTRLYQPPPAR